jgi:hypothetical protein
MQDDRLLSYSFEQASALYPWIKDYRDRSITELEIRHAGMGSTVHRLSQQHFAVLHQDALFVG